MIGTGRIQIHLLNAVEVCLLFRQKRRNGQKVLIEPVLGPAAKMCYEKYGRFGIRDAEALAAQFPEFSYDINKNK